MTAAVRSEVRPNRHQLLEIERQLVAEMGAARRRKSHAGQRFRDLIGAIPLGVTAPDSNLQIREACAEYQNALEACRATLTRFTEFVISGMIPDDCLRPVSVPRCA